MSRQRRDIRDWAEISYDLKPKGRRMHTDHHGKHHHAQSKVAKAMRGKMHKVMHEFKHHELHSGSKHGPEVHSRKQAIAIGMSEARKAAGHKRRHK